MSNFSKHFILEAEKKETSFTQNAAKKVDLSPVEDELAKVLNIPKQKLSVNFRNTKDVAGNGTFKLKRKDLGVFGSVVTKASVNYNCFVSKDKSKRYWRFIFDVEANIRKSNTTAWMDDNYIGAHILVADYNIKTQKWEFNHKGW